MFILLSANAFYLDLSKILSFGTDLTSFFNMISVIPLPDNNILPLSKLKAFADDDFNVTQMLQFFCIKVENIVGKGENAGNQYFLLYQQCFQKSFFGGDCLVKGKIW